MKSNSNLAPITENHTLPLFTLDAILDYATNVKKMKMNDKLRSAIVSAFTSDESYATLALNLTNFNQAMNAHHEFNGITGKQRAELKELILKKQPYKQRVHDRTASDADVQAILAIETRISPLEKTLSWWNANYTALLSDTFWKSARDKAEEQSKLEKESDKKRKQRILKINEIRNEFKLYQHYCGFSGEALLNFLNDFLIPVENYLQQTQHALKKPGSKKISEIDSLYHDYLGYIAQCIAEEKKYITYSMLYRLECVEYYNDIYNDDLLMLTCDRLHHHVNVKPETRGFKPNKRRGLTPTMLKAFSSIIKDYHLKHSDDKLFQDKLSSLQIFQLPNEWRSLIKQAHGLKPEQQNPLILFIINAFDKIVLKIKSDTSNNTLLNKHGAESPSLIEKLAIALNIAELEFKNAGYHPDDLIGRQISKCLTESRRAFNELVKTSIAKVEMESQNYISQLCDDIFTDKMITIQEDKYNVLIKQVMLSNDFVLQQTKKRFSPDTDLILSIAKKIAKRLDERAPLHSIEIKNIVTLLKLITHRGQDVRDTRAYTLLNKAQSLIESSSDYNKAAIIHLSLNMLEIPFETVDDLMLAIERHRYIAARYNEPWIDYSGPLSDNISINTDLLTLTYLQNVYMKIIHISPFVKYDEFDTNDIVKMLDEIQLDDQSKVQELRIALEKYTCEKLNLTTSLNEYFKLKDGIDTRKIKILLDRINDFFTQDEYRKSMIDAVRLAVFGLLKKHCLDAISSKTRFNIVLFTQCDELYKNELSKILKNDTDIIRATRAFNDGYDGSMPRLGELLIQLFPHPKHLQEVAKSYADIRMAYLKREPIPTSVDYRFYKQFGTSHYVKDFSALLTSFLNSTTGWIKAHAGMIEILGDDSQINTYRCMGLTRIIHLLSDPSKEEEAQQRFELFTASQWRGKLHDKYFINPNTKLPDGKTLTITLDLLVSTLAWSPLLRQIINDYGTPAQLRALDMKIQQHLASQSSALKEQPNIDTLSQVIVTLTETLRQLDDENVINEHNLRDFIRVFDTDILSGIEKIVSAENHSFDFNKLTILSNILLSFVSDKLKSLILITYQEQVTSNPYWYHLVNHMFSRKDILDLEQMLSSTEKDVDFMAFLQFAKRLSTAKHKVKFLAKQSLFAEAGITSKEPDNRPLFNQLQPDSLSNDKLMNLWLLSLTKLRGGMTPLRSNASSFTKLIHLIRLINDQIANRIKKSDNKHVLINRFADSKILIHEIKNAIEADPEHSANKILITPLISEVYKLYSLDLLYQLENYIKSEIGNDSKIDLFRKLCTDSSCSLATIKSTLELKQKNDGVKLSLLMKIYNKLNNILIRGDTVNDLAQLIEEVAKEPGIKGSSILGISNFTRQLNRLALLARDYYPDSTAPMATKRSSMSLSLPSLK